jgi:hypothetical protein
MSSVSVRPWWRFVLSGLVVVDLAIGTRHVVVVDHEFSLLPFPFVRSTGWMNRGIYQGKATVNWRAYASLPRATSIAVWRCY